MTTTIETPTYQRILKYARLVHSKPKRNGVYYLHCYDDDKFIIDGGRFKMLPDEYLKYCRFDQFYIHIEPKAKRAMYYAYDIGDFTTGKKTNEEDGYFDWDKIETAVFNFFVINIRELVEMDNPYSENAGEQVFPAQYGNRYDDNARRSNGFNTHTSHHNPTTNSWAYNPNAYKEREAFYDKMNAFLKECQTSRAIDHINDTINKMYSDEKFDDLDTVVRMLPFDKMNIPSLLSMCRVLQDKPKVREGKHFFSKVKDHLTKLKPIKADTILRGLEPIAPIVQT
jgi:hypothetical protein